MCVCDLSIPPARRNRHSELAWSAHPPSKCTQIAARAAQNAAGATAVTGAPACGGKVSLPRVVSRARR